MPVLSFLLELETGRFPATDVTVHELGVMALNDSNSSFAFIVRKYLSYSSNFCELSDLYSLPNIVRMVKSRRMRWAGHVARMGERRDVYRVLVGKTEGKRPLWRPRRRWENNIKMDLQ